MKEKFIILIFIILFVSGCNTNAEHLANQDTEGNTNADPLPSGTDGVVKQSIIAYVKNVTDSTGNQFIPPADRIATFDNDETLWAERPYVQELFAFYMAKRMVAKDSTLTNKQPFKAVIENDKSYFSKGGEKALVQLLEATHTRMTEDEFEATVKDFYSTATYPGLNVPIGQIVYQPQIELLDFLRLNGFKTFICTGGTVEFVRGISQQLYGIPKYQVIGTTFKYKFIDSSNSILRETAVALTNDKEDKPVSIQEHIGQRPVFACGNEGGAGDIAMLKYCQGNTYPSLQVIINHDDSTREFFYQEKDSASLKAAAKNNWWVVSIKQDWRTVFPAK